MNNIPHPESLLEENRQLHSYIEQLKAFLLRQQSEYQSLETALHQFERLSRAGFWVFYPENESTYFSPQMQVLLGLNEALSPSLCQFRQALNDLDTDKFEGALRELYLHQTSVSFTHTLQVPGQAPKQAQTHLSAQFGPKGQLHKLLGIVENLSASDNKHPHNEKFYALAQQLDNPLLTLGPDFRIDGHNPAFTRLTGMRTNEVLTFPWEVILRKMQVSENCLQKIRARQQKNVPFQIEILVVNLAGEKRDCLLNFSPVVDARLEIQGYTCIFTDISPLKSLEFELHQSNQQLQVQYEELHQQQEEIMAQRDFIDHKNRELENRNQQIRHSINAARVIQRAVLPSEALFNQHFDDFFILNQPKDTVGGDIYWADLVNNQMIIAAIDCTGHGVPGGFMSLIAKNLLDNIVKVARITQPALILEQLQVALKEALRQEEIGNSYGMDLGIMSIEKHTQHQHRVLFAGAKRPLYLICAGAEEVEEIKGDRLSIGSGLQSENKFLQHERYLPAKSLLYLSSDGYADQNDARRKCFGEKRLKDLLYKHQGLPLARQKAQLKQSLAQHSLHTLQRDDVLLMGFRLS
ncbi:MAG: hypothetical protein OHK0053_34920 [Microscillaceae bacterium]